MSAGLHVKYSLILLHFNEIYIVSAVFRKILKYQISRKQIQWEPTDGQTDGQTDTTKLTVAFPQFCERA
jgi:hypothetical protein